MKRLALFAAVLVVAACSTKEEAPPADSMAPAMTPAPAPMDTGMRMMDSSMKMDTMMRDTMMRDSMMKRDTTPRP